MQPKLSINRLKYPIGCSVESKNSQSILAEHSHFGKQNSEPPELAIKLFGTGRTSFVIEVENFGLEEPGLVERRPTIKPSGLEFKIIVVEVVGFAEKVVSFGFGRLVPGRQLPTIRRFGLAIGHFGNSRLRLDLPML